MAQPTDQTHASGDFDDAIDRLRADYDTTPYTSNSFPQSAPGHLAAIAHLFGLETPEVSTARVLEIGCAAGGNLIPFAAAHPQAHVVGIDLSQVQVDQGSTRAQALGLNNLQLLAGDIARTDLEALGQFDFIIAHGVFSWVPAEVQEALLSTFRRLLAPEGVAYMSYNVYPGWKAKEIVRDAMLLASGDSVTPEEKVREARRMADFLEEVAPVDGVLARVLAMSRAHALGFGDSYLLHDELEAFNAPCYFYEIAGTCERARSRLPGRGPSRDDDPRQLRSQGCRVFGRQVWRRAGAGRAVPGFCAQPRVPRIAVDSCRARTAYQIQPG